ncbi:10263_t:CDS:2 [Funneliformis geosporum]|uniref:ATP synthase F(0) complex subunit e, mitochondrial n=1 Tax=Funneliformis geosporum TaxID=1117311 RepID=A0A9W4SG84_9GLOM|nr:4037_t:CDS:2 [Funneliformis geosporum]CAI2172704.1 10263_t:CDS:2 [Funneliformis geosporum]
MVSTNVQVSVNQFIYKRKSRSIEVARWTALALGITYGFVHKKSLVNSEAKKKEISDYKHKEALINEAKAAYVASIASKNLDVITDPNDPNFDLEKLLKHAEKQQ